MERDMERGIDGKRHGMRNRWRHMERGIDRERHGKSNRWRETWKED